MEEAKGEDSNRISKDEVLKWVEGGGGGGGAVFLRGGVGSPSAELRGERTARYTSILYGLIMTDNQ